MKQRPFFERYSLLILMVAFFLVPFGLRGARMAVRGMRNDVKDWLPDRFEETVELEWFREHFPEGTYVVLSWDGCTGAADDERFRLLMDKFHCETPPSQRGAVPPLGAARSETGESFVSEELGLYVRDFKADKSIARQEFIGNQYGFFVTGDYHQNWGGSEEKWFKAQDESWHYILPDGDIYRWLGMDTLPGKVGRILHRWGTGENKLEGEFVAATGVEDGPWYYNDPRRLEADLFSSVISGPSLLDELTCENGALEGKYEIAKERLTGLLFGADGEQTCLLVSLSAYGKENLHRIVGRGMMGKPPGKLHALAVEAGLQPAAVPSMLPPPLDLLFTKPPPRIGPELRLGGPPVDNVAIDEEGQSTLARLVGLSVLLGITISWLSFRSNSVTLLLFFVGAASAVTSLGLVWWSGSGMDAILMSMPSLVYVLGMSGAVHIVNYYRDTVKESGFPGSPGDALRAGIKPCTIAAMTTALGLVSLARSEIVPIRKFGFFSALAVVFTLLFVFTVLPAGLHFWPPKSFRRLVRGANTRQEGRLAGMITAFWNGVGELVLRRHGLVAVTSLVVLIICGFGLTRLNTSVQLLKLFHPSSKIINDYQWLEDRLCKLVPMELMVNVKPDAILTSEGQDSSVAPSPEDKFRLSYLERFEIVENIRSAVSDSFGADAGDIVGQSMSPVSFVPPLPGSGGSALRASMRGAYSKRYASYRDRILETEYYRVDKQNNNELWRIALRVGAMSDVDYGEFVGDLKTAVEPVLTAYPYRDKVLRTIDSRREGNGYRGGKVLMLGAKLDFLSQFAPDLLPTTDDEPVASDTPQGAVKQPVDQLALFSKTLRQIMKNSALSVRDWHDPRFALPVDWLDRASSEDFDCVVVVGDDPRYEELLAMGLPHVHDARDYGYAEDDPIAYRDGAAVSVRYTGMVPVVYKAQRTLLQSLVTSSMWAFAAISVVMIVLLRSLRAGAVSMLPNVFPVVVVFGCMGWSEILVDIGSMMTASVAMGVAVDDTIHFLTWFRRALDEGKSRQDAIRTSYDRCATAMTQTTLIAGLGMAVFALSTFTPTQRFGILMLVLMLAALVGDLIFLPAILAGPFGRVFEKTVKPRDAGNGPHVDHQGDALILGDDTVQMRRRSEPHAIRRDVPH